MRVIRSFYRTRKMFILIAEKNDQIENDVLERGKKKTK